MKQLLMHGLVTCSIFLALSACKTSDSNTDLKVINGTKPDPSGVTATSTVALATKNDDDEYKPFCSGTLVSPTLIMTAAHCLSTSEKIYAVFTGDTEDLKAVDIKIVSSGKHPLAGTGSTTNFDIAWVKLKKPAPSSYKPIEVLRSSDALTINSEVLMAGFGKKASDCDAVQVGCLGVLLEAKAKLNAFINTPRFFNLMLVHDEVDGHSVCNGDSGGPAFVQVKGKTYLAGVLNGTNALASGKAPLDPKKRCEFGYNLYTFAGSYIDWIIESSGEKLSFNDKLNPKKTPAQMVSTRVTDTAFSLKDMLEYRNASDPLWRNVDILLNKVASDKKLSVEDRYRLYSDVDYALKMLLDYKELNVDVLLSLGSEISDVRPLAKMENLEILGLSGMSVKDFSPLVQLTKLKSLRLGNNYEKGKDLFSATALPMDFAFLAKMPWLEELDLSRNPNNLKLEAIPWDSLGTLKSLVLSSNAGIDLTKIKWSALVGLKKLTIADSGLTDISPLKDLPNVEIIYLPYNAIIDLSPLRSLHSLQEINITGAKVTDISPLFYLPNLRKLSFRSNPVVNKDCPSNITCEF